MTIKIRSFQESDWPAVWGLLKPVFRAGDTYSFSTDISQEKSRRVWIDTPASSYVATDESGKVFGTYYIKTNQPGQGSHVCNCGYVVGPSARGKGVATAMCLHSQNEAINLGYLAMQFNLVVATNEGAIRLWRKLGFEIVGTLPQVFNHPGQGYVDAFVMFKQLIDRVIGDSQKLKP